jgi:hypothetical protein
VAGSLHAAETPAALEIRKAIQNLDNQSSYTWISTPKSELPGASSQQGPTEGKAEKGGYTYFKLKIADNTVEAALKGDKSAIKTESAWESSDALEGDRAWIGRRLKSFAAPVAEAADLLSKSTRLKQEKAGLYSGDLTSEGVKELMTARSRAAAAGPANAPRETKGWVKFTVKDGALAKYEFNLQGKVIGQDFQEHDINRTTTVQIQHAGSTAIVVPEEAKKKLQ